MSNLPLVNATLERIAGGGTSEDYDTPAGTDAERWAGEEDAYLREELLTVTIGERRDEVQATRVTVPLSPGELATRGDSITYTYADEQVTRTLRSIEVFRIYGTVRLTFWDA